MSGRRVALRASAIHAPTLKEVPSEAEIASHRLMLRAGLMRKAAAGIYSFLPLGYRSVRKVEQIVREEMDGIGSHELLLPVVQPAELWHESGRWAAYGPELARFTDRAGRDFCLGPTHEEIITALLRNEVRSYRELPISLYQINVKFRDEMRPRFGLLRAREFIMKDAYSFHASHECLEAHYAEQAAAYGRICDRLGLTWRAVKAESGQIGGSVTTEFMALADSGEAEIVHCSLCDWAANVEAAEVPAAQRGELTDRATTLERVATPGLRTIADLAEAFGVPERDTVKTMAGKTADGLLVFFCFPGERELNTVKAGSVIPGCALLSEEEFELFDIPKGSLGPVAPPPGTLVVADHSLQRGPSWMVGANEDGFHYRGVMPGRDFDVDLWADLVLARADDACPECGGALSVSRGIEVSQVFQLGTTYSAAMGATFMSDDGVETPFVMGCYGVGVTRSLAAVVEQHHDERGIVWPMSVAPLQVAVIPLAPSPEVIHTAERIWNGLADIGIETVIDDRNVRAGVKFADNELIGYPIQVVVGSRGATAGVVEVRLRGDGTLSEVAVDRAVEYVDGLVREAMASLSRDGGS